MFSFELYLADAATGKILKKLTSSTRDQRFEQISYINSAGAWSPDGKKFAIPVYDKGKSAIVFFNMATRKIERMVPARMTSMRFINSPGRPTAGRLFFSAPRTVTAGCIAAESGRKPPSRLPSGGTATSNRSGRRTEAPLPLLRTAGPLTNLDSLTFSPLRLGLLDVATKNIITAAISEKAAAHLPAILTRRQKRLLHRRPGRHRQYLPVRPRVARFFQGDKRGDRRCRAHSDFAGAVGREKFRENCFQCF